MNRTIVFLVKSLSVADFEFDAATMRNLEKSLLFSGLDSNAREYSSFTLVFSVLSSILFLLSALFFSLVPLQAFAFSLLFFSLCVFCLLRLLPEALAKRRAEEVERDLPVFLRSFSAELRLNVPFETALENAGAGLGLLSCEFGKAFAEIRSGFPVRDSLCRIANRVQGTAVERAVMQMVFAYENGLGEGDGLARLADELVQQQRIRAREFAGKQAFFGLLLITLSIVLPAFFSAFAIIGSSFLNFSFTPQDVFVAFAFVFPLLDASVLFYLSEAKPKLL